MHSWIRGAFAVLLSAPSLCANAQWTGKGEAGLVFARGNSTTNTANVKFELTRELVYWKHALAAAGVYASDDTGTTTQRWDVQQQSDYKFSERGFLFGKLRYEEDRFSSYFYQGTASTGLGYRLYDDDVTKLSSQIGAGYRTSKTRAGLEDDGVTVIPEARDNEAIFSAAVDFKRSLTLSTTLNDKLTIESGATNTFTQNDLSFQVKITDVLALSLGYSVRHNSNPSSEFEKTDTLSTVNLVYEIK